MKILKRNLNGNITTIKVSWENYGQNHKEQSPLLKAQPLWPVTVSGPTMQLMQPATESATGVPGRHRGFSSTVRLCENLHESRVLGKVSWLKHRHHQAIQTNGTCGRW